MIPPVNIVIVTYNRLHFTKQCLVALKKFTQCPHSVTIVDNASQDGTREYLLNCLSKKEIDRLLLLDKNYGVAAAANTGWEFSSDGIYLKLDNDIMVQRSGWLKHMVKTANEASRQKIGALCHDIYAAEHEEYPITTLLQNTSVSLPPNGMELYGGAVMIIPEVFKQFGFWCEDFGQYSWEDSDYGARIAWQGWQTGFVRGNKWIIHEGEREVVTNPEYVEIKKRKFASTTRTAGENLMMYALKLRPLRMRRRYLTCIATDGVSCTLQPDADYFTHESAISSRFRQWIKSLSIKLSFPRGHDEGAEFNILRKQLLKLINKGEFR
ncbi:MAG: glycosyltransferase [Candidatus Cloacimonetes bacterium]|nr:glycosyltransferase [Candidatus Cloacimonadota bacterium]